MKPMRLKNWNYSSQAAYFITICIKNRQTILSDIVHDQSKSTAAGKIVEYCWKELVNDYNCILDEFIIMPDYMHGIIFINTDQQQSSAGPIHELALPSNPLDHQAYSIWRKQRRIMLLPKMIGKFKMRSAKIINELYHTKGNALWQKGYYEKIIHNQTQLNNIRLYIKNNPKNVK